MAAALAAVAISAVALGWLQDPPDLTADDAVQVAEDAFSAAGLDASMAREPVRSTYTPDARTRVDAWSVLVTVRDEPVEIQFERSGARPLLIDDRILDGSSYLLTDAEHESVARHVDDPTRARALRRNLALTVAAILVVALSIAHAALVTAPKETVP